MAEKRPLNGRLKGTARFWLNIVSKDFSPLCRFFSDAHPSLGYPPGGQASLTNQPANRGGGHSGPCGEFQGSGTLLCPESFQVFEATLRCRALADCWLRKGAAMLFNKDLQE